jgi:hemerythrin superfamily protein
MDVFEELIQEHEEVKGMFEQLMEKGKQKQLFDKLQKELSAHMEAEEKVVYKRFEGEEATHQLVLEAQEEHRVAKRVMNELDRADGDKWEARLKVLFEMIQHHIEEEENSFFPEARKIVDQKQAEELREQFEERKKAA